MSKERTAAAVLPARRRPLAKNTSLKARRKSARTADINKEGGGSIKRKKKIPGVPKWRDRKPWIPSKSPCKTVANPHYTRRRIARVQYSTVSCMITMIIMIIIIVIVIIVIIVIMTTTLDRTAMDGTATSRIQLHCTRTFAVVSVARREQTPVLEIDNRKRI